jgi:ABC-type branched-subunit amino acid transport system ATPase component
MEVLEFCELTKRKDAFLRGSIGDRKRLKRPRPCHRSTLLLLDETMAGLTPRTGGRGN